MMRANQSNDNYALLFLYITVLNSAVPYVHKIIEGPLENCLR